MSDQRSGWGMGFTGFASFMMIMLGAFSVLNGLAAIIKDQFFVLTTDYAFKFDITTWGWVHLVLGVVVLIAGFGLMSGAVWARTIAVILAVVSAIVNFAYLPWFPVWASLVIAIDVLVIWAVTVHGRDMRDMSGSM
jgi:hypothetical protein